MFRFLFKLIKIAVVLGILAVLAAFFLPRQYEHEENIEILAPQKVVYEKARHIERWHLAASLSALDPNQLGAGGGAAAGRIDSLLPMNLGGQLLGSDWMNVKIQVISESAPKGFRYRVDGGPMPGMEADVECVAVDEQKTRVFIKERYQFPGFFGGVKALTAKYGSGQVNQSSLDQLKTIVEMK